MSDKTKTFFKRLFSTVILLSLLGGAVAWNNVIGYGVLLCLFCNLTTWEWFVMLKETPACRKLGLVMGLVYPWSLFAISHATQAYRTGGFALGFLVLFVLLAFFVNLFCMDYKGRTGREALESMGLTLLAFVYPVWLFAFALKWVIADNLPHSGMVWALLWLILFTKMSDIWAYVSGVLLGGRFFTRKFSPTVSPKKTWEGIIGSFILTLTAGWFLMIWLLDGRGMRGGDVLIFYLIFAPILFVLSVAGDLAGSLIKRGLAVKDSGSLLPGIGGIFDLIDSPAFTVSFVIAVCPALDELVRVFLSL